MEIINRASLRLLKDKKDLVGVEIGLNLGYNAKNILENLDIKTLYCIDPYLPYEGFSKEKVDNWKNIMYSGFKGKYDNVVIIEKTSSEAYMEIPNELDFVYIDGGHIYSTVFSDLFMYHTKIKNGGLLCGDNFEFIFVRCAVYDFVVFTKKSTVLLSGIGENKDCNSIDWWIWV
jgi:hypothetical protein